nr:PREDICTED: uncharacterized protein LOC108221384 [Daucus carota subsp. sativus]
MPGLDESIARHRLNVHPQAVPVKQKKRNFAVERQKVIEAQVEKLLEAKFIEEIEYPERLANVVVVKKSNNKWRMCVDYTDLNKNCPKDHYPLPNIDQLIDATSGYQILSFLDAFSGYHQIAMDAEDIPKTAFITPKGTYAYIKMPFGLKNAGATFQRMVNKVFADQIGRNMEYYVDDMIVKSLFRDHADDLKECFETLRRNNMKINPAKCTFGVCSGKFLGYMVSARGIEANPEKIKAVLEMEAPKTIRDIQKLTGRLAALRRFISRSAEKALPFFEVLKGAKNFEWGPNCIKAFEEIKEYLVKAPLLLRPDPKETLQLYLAVSDRTLGAVLVKEHEKNQHPVFYVSHMLRDAETRYPNAEKFAYGLVMASRKLRHYFQGRTIQVVTDQPLKKILSRPEASGRVVAWSVELGEYDLEYVPRTAIKAQALVDFMVECIFSGPKDLEPKEQLIRTPGKWKLFVDGSVAESKCGAGLILSSPDGFEICQAIRFTFPLTNNEAEYEALLAGMGLAKNLEVRHLRAFSDSMLVVKHFSGEYEQNEPRTKAYAAKVREQTQFFETFELSAIGREDNGRADALSRLASAETQNLTGSIYLTEVKKPSVDKKACLEIHQGINWMTPIRTYLEKGILPLEKKEAQKQGNGAIEAANKIIFHGIKKRLGEAKGLWAEELPWVLWAYRTTPRSSTGETPFRLAYGTDSLVSVEVGLESYRTRVFNPDTNEYGLRGNLDLLEEEREAAHHRNVRYQQQASQYYDSGIRKRSFRVGDMVLRDLATSMPTKQGKLMPNWEGPYTVVEIVRPGTYKLAASDGSPIKNTWHASQLRKYYQ